MLRLVFALSILLVTGKSYCGTVFHISNGGTSFHVIASAHGQIGGMDALPKSWVNVISGSSRVCFEIDETSAEALNLEYAKVARSSSKNRADSAFTTEEINEVLEKTEKLNGLPRGGLRYLSTFAPYFFVDAIASLIPTEVPSGGIPDLLARQVAKKAGVVECAIETPASALGYGHSISHDEARLYFNYIQRLLANSHTRGVLASHARIVDGHFRDGNIDEVCIAEAKFLNENYLDQVYKKTIIARTKQQLERMLRTTEESANVTFIVGVLHVCGPDGILESLRGRGYSIVEVGAADSDIKGRN